MTDDRPGDDAGAQPESHPPTQRAVEYKGGPLDAEKGPGLGCFWIQVVVLAIVVVLTPLSAAWNWPIPITIFLLALTLVLLLFVGQTVIFLLRLVAADRRTEGRRRPLRSETKTVGEIEDEAGDGEEPREPSRPADPAGPTDPSVRE
ncbi:MAG TPA: hypothetical protein VGM49_01590 [Candidatus Limnocylindrales bacterium]